MTLYEEQISGKRGLDFWMYHILNEALDELYKKKCFDSRGKRVFKDNMNRFSESGKINCTKERLRKMQEILDKQGKKDLGLKVVK